MDHAFSSGDAAPASPPVAVNDAGVLQSVAGSNSPAVPDVVDEPPLRVMALHALAYCERLFYLEEVEEIRVADHAVYAGRRLHEEVVSLEDETPERRSVEIASEVWGIFGKLDAVRRRDGHWIVYEHKKGRSRRDDDNQPVPWESDRLQAIAYAVLLEEELGEPIPQARVRYHADNVTAFVAVDAVAKQDLRRAIERARELRRTTQRPPVHSNENVCKRCSLAVVCLPEEERLAPSIQASGASEFTGLEQEEPDSTVTALVADDSPPADRGRSCVSEIEETAAHRVPTLFPSNRERQTLHVVSPRAYVSRSGEALVVTVENDVQEIPIQEVDALVIHGSGQVTTQAIHLCASKGVAIQWLTAGGKWLAGAATSPGRVQQRIRQFAALTDPARRLELARRLVRAKVEVQLRYLLRATRGDAAARQASRPGIDRIRESLKGLPRAAAADSLRGLEGMAAKSYFACLNDMLVASVPPELRFDGRNRHPPRDRINCLLGFGYALLQSLVHRSILAVGLEPALGFFHQPRTAAPPLVLDVMELFRTLLWEVPLIGSVNRGQWHVDDDFEVRPEHVWLSNSGRRKAIQLFEQRLQEAARHPYTGQSLEYARMVEMEIRLLEKEWTGCPGLFAQFRLR